MPRDKDKKAASDKRYREAHREELLEKKREYMKLFDRCSCGLDYRRNHMSIHLKTAKHTRLLQKQEQDTLTFLEEKTSPDVARLILSFCS